jgi:hypothetical protein
LHQDHLQRRADATEINLHGAEIPPDNLTPLRAEFADHSRAEAGLSAQELEIPFVEKVAHWAIPPNGEFVEPISGHREATRR